MTYIPPDLCPRDSASRDVEKSDNTVYSFCTITSGREKGPGVQGLEGTRRQQTVNKLCTARREGIYVVLLWMVASNLGRLKSKPGSAEGCWFAIDEAAISQSLPTNGSHQWNCAGSKSA